MRALRFLNAVGAADPTWPRSKAPAPSGRQMVAELMIDLDADNFEEGASNNPHARSPGDPGVTVRNALPGDGERLVPNGLTIHGLRPASASASTPAIRTVPQPAALHDLRISR